MPLPKIAVMLDENTSEGGNKYELPKDYFSAITHFGGIPFGIPYEPSLIECVADGFDGFFSTGGSIGMPENWFVGDQKSLFPTSERIAVESAIMKEFLQKDKPVLAACHGMQILAALHGCQLKNDVTPAIHCDKEHLLNFVPDTKTAQILGVAELNTNSFHSEGIATVCSPVLATAHSSDGQVEAIEISDKKFAIGYQWHQEKYWKDNHVGNKLFEAFISSAKI